MRELGSYSSSWIFWNSLKRGDVSSLSDWENSPVKPSSPGHLFAWSFLITASILLVVIQSIQFSASPWFDFRRLYASRNLSILPRLSIYLAYSSYCFLTILCSSVMLLLLLFHFWFYLFGSFFCCFWVMLKSHQFCLSFQKTSFWLHWSFGLLLFFLSLSCFFCSELYYFLPSLSGLCLLLFFSSFRCRVKFYIWDFSCLWGKPIMVWTSLSVVLLLCL